MRLLNILVVTVLLSAPELMRADDVQTGQVSFDVATSGSPGLNNFEIDNFTGINNLFGILSPVADNVAFLDATLTVTCANAACASDLGGTTDVISLGDIDPGTVFTEDFSGADTFSQAVFSADYSETSLGLTDSTTFLGSSSVTADLLPSSGATLQSGEPGDSVALFDSSAQTSSVPEPSILLLLFSGLAAVASLRGRLRAAHKRDL